MRGMPMVATSPVQYEDHSTVSSTPGPGAPPGGVACAEPSSPERQQYQQQPAQQHQQAPSVQSPTQQQPVDIHAYQPPWKNLIDYAQQQQQQSQQPAPTVTTAGAGPQSDRLNAASPRYQRLMSQVSLPEGISGATCSCGRRRQRTKVRLTI